VEKIIIDTPSKLKFAYKKGEYYMKCRISENENMIFTGTAREILSLWRKLTQIHMEDWTFSLNLSNMDMSKDYILYVDKVDGYGEYFTHPQMGIKRINRKREKKYAAILIKNIVWEEEDSIENLALPEEVVITDNIQEDKIADYLSERYEFLVKNYEIEYLSPEELYKKGAMDFVKWFSEEIGDISTARNELFVADGNKWMKAIDLYLKTVH